MTSITWAGPRCVQELGTFLAPQNRIQGRCEYYVTYWQRDEYVITGPRSFKVKDEEYVDT